MRPKTRTGFTLIELMIVVAIVAIVAAIAIPGMMRARIAANEANAIGTLRTIATAQEQFRTAALVEMDSDGSGEYGYFQELSGFAATRGGLVAEPAFCASQFGSSAASGGAPPPAAIASKAGYHFVIYLPTAAGFAQAEEAPLPAGAPVDANLQETRWAAYAWPRSYEASGIRCFVENQEGLVYGARNAGGLYDGPGGRPPPQAAFEVASPDPDNLDGWIAAGSAAASGDGQVWSAAGG